jgi:hypothetical protein
MKRKIVLIVIAIIAVTGLIGAYFYFKQTPDVVQKAPDVAINARELIAAFEQDTAAAHKAYIDKIVAVTGVVKSIDTAGAIVLGEQGQCIGSRCRTRPPAHG